MPILQIRKKNRVGCDAYSHSATATLIIIAYFHLMQNQPEEDTKFSMLEKRMEKIETLLESVINAQALEDKMTKNKRTNKRDKVFSIQVMRETRELLRN